MKTRLLPAIGAAALVAGLVLGACSSDHGSMGMSTATTVSPVAIPTGAEFNATDVAFAQGMIPHHAQAIVMADMALGQSTDPEVTKLATEIKAAQSPEIEQLETWLEAWGQPVPDITAGADHSMDGMDGMMMSGMMSDADMARLESTTGADFDTMWLEMMIQHHEGAISMSRDEMTGGKYGPTKALAESIIASQQVEIDTMSDLLANAR